MMLAVRAGELNKVHVRWPETTCLFYFPHALTQNVSWLAVERRIVFNSYYWF